MTAHPGSSTVSTLAPLKTLAIVGSSVPWSVTFPEGSPSLLSYVTVLTAVPLNKPEPEMSVARLEMVKVSIFAGTKASVPSEVYSAPKSAKYALVLPSSMATAETFVPLNRDWSSER